MGEREVTWGAGRDSYWQGTAGAKGLLRMLEREKAHWIGLWCSF